MKILYVDAISEITAQQNIKAYMNAYKKNKNVSKFYIFDYRKKWLKKYKELCKKELKNKQVLAKKIAINYMNKELINYATKFKPDFIHLGKCEYISGKTIRNIKRGINTFIIHYYGDYSQEGIKRWVSEIGKYADYTLLCHDSSERSKKYMKTGIKHIGYWSPGIDPERYKNMKPIIPDIDVIFVGNNSDMRGNLRRDILSLLDKTNFKISVYGKNWEKMNFKNIKVYNYLNDIDFPLVCSRAKISISENNDINNVQLYASWRRILNSMAAGTCHLAKYIPGLETIFKNDYHLKWFENPKELVRMIKYLLEHDTKRINIANNGRNEVLKKHTMNIKIQELLNLKLKRRK